MPGPAHQNPTRDSKQDSKPTRPVHVFQDLDGHWAGTFVGYDVRINSQLLEHNVSGGILVHF